MLNYINQFSTLNTAKIAGRRAPHKAVLLLAIMDLVETGEIDSPRIVLSEQLQEAFNGVWKRMVGNSPLFQPNVAIPFWHMRGEHFYRLYLENGQIMEKQAGWYSIKGLREHTYAMIDDRLFHYMQNRKCREKLREVLIDTYISSLHKGIGGSVLASTIIPIFGIIIHLAA